MREREYITFCNTERRQWRLGRQRLSRVRDGRGREGERGEEGGYFDKKGLRLADVAQVRLSTYLKANCKL